MPIKDGPIDFFLDHVGQTMPDLIFLQMEPMPYLVRQRYCAHKNALHEVEDYDKKAIENL